MGCFSSRTLPCQRLALRTRRASAEIGRSGTPLASAFLGEVLRQFDNVGRAVPQRREDLQVATLRRNSRSSRNELRARPSRGCAFEVAMMRLSNR